MLFIWLLQVIVGAVVTRASIYYVDRKVDDYDHSINYSGTWESHPSALSYGGSHRISSGDDAQAVFTFIGVSGYYLAPLWPYKMDCYISVDDLPPQLVNLTLPSPTTTPGEVNVGDETVEFDVRWTAMDLGNGTHRVTITPGPSGYAIVDGFRYVRNF
ncbi:hypothetical protein FRC17_005767 [Serendipita sp. 399]|nr:hypothetical protein FRC17_005767 [Serendipita sp. 399]